MNTKLTIALATWNSRQFLPSCLESIFNQSYLRKEGVKINIFLIDNASTDGSLEWIQKNYPEVGTLKNQHNLGTAKAWNQAIKLCKTEYILILNPDVVLDKNFVDVTLEYIEKNPHIGSLGGKILQAQWTKDELRLVEKTANIDSTGLKLTKSRRVVDIGQGEKDLGQFDNPCARFGVSGACFMFRKNALEDIKCQNEYFDEDLFMYKEDIDIAYRLLLRDWLSVYLPQALCYHFRSAIGSEKNKANLKIAANRLKKSAWINYISYRNHLLILYKNEISKVFLRNFIFIFWYEFRKLVFIVFAEPKTIKAIHEFFKLRKKFKAKRKFIQDNKKINPEEFQKWVQ